MDLFERLSSLFGTEEYVSMRRHLVHLRENIINSISIYNKIVCSGSLGEGVAYPGSDDDLMFCHTSFRVVKSFTDATQWRDLLMVPSEFSPCYCLLLFVSLYRTNYPNSIVLLPFLSSVHWKTYLLREGESVHGPCASQSFCGYEYDRAHCIKCYFWPNVADNWIMRNRSHGWPSRDMIRNIVMDGCHVVPIGDKTSSFGQNEWRISFSVAERKLFHSFNHTQFLTYNLLRLSLKRFINERCPDVMCSYFMKTTLFYVSENTSTQFWQPGNIEECFRTCLSVLHDYVYHGYCPNFFIPEYNMIQSKLNHSNRYLLLNIIRFLHSICVLGTMYFCGEYACLERNISLAIIQVEHDIDLFYYPFHLTVNSLLEVFDNLPYANNVSSLMPLCRVLRLLQCDSIGKLNHIFVRRLITYHCQNLINSLENPVRTLYIPMNKRNYNLHKTIQFLLRVIYNEDLTTGKLTAATYMYLVGKTESSLLYIRRLLSEYPPYAIDLTLKDLKISAYMDAMCDRGYTMDYKVQRALSPPYLFLHYFTYAFPSPLRILMAVYKTKPIGMDSLSYAYFLESLCHIRLQDHTSLLKSTRCLKDRLMDYLFDFPQNINARICVGLIKYVQGDTQSACRWMGSSYLVMVDLPTIIKRELSYSVMTYIACMINHRLSDENHT